MGVRWVLWCRHGMGELEERCLRQQWSFHSKQQKPNRANVYYHHPDVCGPSKQPSSEAYVSSQHDTKALGLVGSLFGKSLWGSFSFKLSGKPPYVRELSRGQVYTGSGSSLVTQAPSHSFCLPSSNHGS